MRLKAEPAVNSRVRSQVVSPLFDADLFSLVQKHVDGVARARDGLPVGDQDLPEEVRFNRHGVARR